MNVHDFIRAEQAFGEALNTSVSKETSTLISDLKIKCCLLQAYYYMNDIDSAIPILQELMSWDIDDYYEQGLDEEDIYAIYTINSEWGKWTRKDIFKLKKMLFVVTQNIEQNGPEEMQLIFIYSSVLLIIESGWATIDESKIYLKMIKGIRQNQYFLSNTNLQILMFRTLARIAAELKLPEEEEYIEKFLELSIRNEVSTAAKAELCQSAASFYYGKGQKNKGNKYLYDSLDMITQEWHFAIRYWGKRIYQILDSMQLNFLGCYDVIRKYKSTEFAYEKLLQFKSLASLAIRERNRVIYSGKISKDLSKKVQDVQNIIAHLEADRIFLGKKISKNTENEFKKLEANWVDLFPEDISFMDITFAKIQEAIPDNSAIIEYFVYEIDYEKHEFIDFSLASKTAIDLYVLCKKNNHCCLKRWTIFEGSRILKESRNFVSILQKRNNFSGILKKEKEILRESLFHELIEPFLSFIQGINQLYIAPDRDLINLPFEILYDQKNAQLEEYCDITKIECARDFLFRAPTSLSAKGSLIVGNPNYTIHKSNATKIPSLPFAEIEAKKISSYYSCAYYSGNQASKALFYSVHRYRNIHIATHGYFDLSNSSKRIDSAYSSSLMFAGAGDWMYSKKADEQYGNGIVTADEISRMDLRSVELVVLSSCMSGMNKIIEDKGLHGLVGAFSEAGVHYVISHLWQANDFATMILMDNFYNHYVRENLPPSAALRLAKKFLKNMTIRQLKQEGWLAILASKNKALSQRYEEYDDYKCPFEAEEYWGGFSCYKCRG